MRSERELLGVAAGAAAALGVLAATVRTGHASLADEAVRGWLAPARERRAVRAAAKAVKLFGYPVTYLPIAYALARALRRRGAREGGAVLEAAFVGWGTYRFVKYAMPRDRPLSQAGARNFREAFPSGHTSAATSIAVAAALVARRERVMGLPAALAAGVLPSVVMAASRVLLDEHWPTDVLGGWLTGSAAAALATGRRGVMRRSAERAAGAEGRAHHPKVAARNEGVRRKRTPR